MVNKQERQDMIDEVLNRIEAEEGVKVVEMEIKVKDLCPESRRKGNIVTNCALAGKNGIVILVDRAYSEEIMAELYKSAWEYSMENSKNGAANASMIFYKDDETFFRSAAKSLKFPDKGSVHYHKMMKDMGLKRYSMDDLRRAIEFRPEEQYYASLSIHRGKQIEMYYFQPESERLKRGIRRFMFEPMILDRTHLPSYHPARWNGKTVENSKRLHIWRDDKMLEGKLKLENCFLREIPSIVTSDYK